MRLWTCLLLLASFAAAADKKAEDAVLAAAKDLSQAQMKKDQPALERLLAEELVYSHSSAMRETKAEHIKAVMKPNSRYTNISFSEPMVRLYGNTAVLITKATFSVDNDGKKADNHLSMQQTWVKKGTAWQLMARWTTRMP